MCLVLPEGFEEKNIADEDIVCYKILKRSNLTPPYFPSFHYTLGKDTVEVMPKPEPDPLELDVNVMVVESAYHSYRDLQAAMLWLAHFQPRTAVYAVFKAVIPKGSTYYEGLDKDYASSSLRIIEEYVCA